MMYVDAGFTHCLFKFIITSWKLSISIFCNKPKHYVQKILFWRWAAILRTWMPIFTTKIWICWSGSNNICVIYVTRKIAAALNHALARVGRKKKEIESNAWVRKDSTLCEFVLFATGSRIFWLRRIIEQKISNGQRIDHNGRRFSLPGCTHVVSKFR